MGLLATLTGWRLLRGVLRVIVLLVLAVVIYLLVTLVQVWLTGQRYDPHQASAIVVMGAAQYNGVPSPDLRARLDQAALLWHQKYATTVMVTGYKEKGDQFTEAEASARYLESVGVPASDILQAGGTDSWQNLSQAAPQLLARGDRTVLMVTDRFHEDRSMAIASTLGLSPSPTPTKSSPITGWSSVPYYAKETVGVALGRIIGWDHLDSLHSFGVVMP